MPPYPHRFSSNTRPRMSVARPLTYQSVNMFEIGKPYGNGVSTLSQATAHTGRIQHVHARDISAGFAETVISMRVMTFSECIILGWSLHHAWRPTWHISAFHWYVQGLIQSNIQCLDGRLRYFEVLLQTGFNSLLSRWPMANKTGLQRHCSTYFGYKMWA